MNTRRIGRLVMLVLTVAMVAIAMHQHDHATTWVCITLIWVLSIDDRMDFRT